MCVMMALTVAWCSAGAEWSVPLMEHPVVEALGGEVVDERRAGAGLARQFGEANHGGHRGRRRQGSRHVRRQEGGQR